MTIKEKGCTTGGIPFLFTKRQKAIIRRKSHLSGPMTTSVRFIHDGRARYYAVIYPEIEAAVQTDFTRRLAQAPRAKRLYLRLLIRREIRRRIEEAVSSRTLY
jgi:hypothetical protein